MSRRDESIAAALLVLETEGEQALTMRRIADEIGVRAPSLYKHIAGRDELIAALQAIGLRAAGQALSVVRAKRTRPTRLAAFAVAYRRLALDRPELYRLTSGRPLLRDLLPDGLEREVGQVLVDVVGGDPDLARALWAFAHGMADLELAGRFPPDADLDMAWRVGVRAFGSS